MTTRDVVLRQWTYTVEEEDWHPPLLPSVTGLTAAQAAWKPSAERHSIWQIVRHVILWKRAVLDRWRGNPPDADALNAADWQDASGDDAAWRGDRAALGEISREVRAMIEQWDDEHLVEPPPNGTKPRVFTAMDLACHDAYHTGQIRYLRALQGA